MCIYIYRQRDRDRETYVYRESTFLHFHHASILKYIISILKSHQISQSISLISESSSFHCGVKFGQLGRLANHVRIWSNRSDHPSDCWNPQHNSFFPLLHYMPFPKILLSKQIFLYIQFWLPMGINNSCLDNVWMFFQKSPDCSPLESVFSCHP